MFTLKEIIAATHGVLIQGDQRVNVQRVSSDSRTTQTGDLFIAIKGEHFDGHAFVKKVHHRHAAAVIVSNPALIFPKKLSVILVKDTVKAFGHIARAHRDKFKIPIIAVTGSTGKTTTKEMLARVLGARYSVLKNVATHNNHIGVPQTLLKLTTAHDRAVIELGTNRFGDIRWLTEVANPTTALFTNIGESHLESLKTSSGVFKEKFELVKNMRPKGVVIFNADDRYLRAILKKKLSHRLISYGIDAVSDYRATNIKVEGMRVRFKVGTQAFQLSAPVIHNVYNALAAIGCARAFGMGYREIARALSAFDFRCGRQAIEKVGGCWVIDDTYNANPVSFRSAIETLKSLNNPGRKVVVCADMLELGKESHRLHYAMGETLAQAHPDMVLSMGRFSKFLLKGIKSNHNGIEAHHCRDLDMIHSRLNKFCRPGDAILVKGSRAMRMERTVQFLQTSLKGKAKV